ncbi:hypothetical protein M426DRAFT_230933 [Hypoxylon sp. CI-4A]|nr:hypothetical protein M426DRAFT_230933 [Hypoxylon sp. CI-4A]
MACPMECLSQGINAQAVHGVTHRSTIAGRRAETMRKSLSHPPSGPCYRSHGLTKVVIAFDFSLVVAVAGYCWAQINGPILSPPLRYRREYRYTSIGNFIKKIKKGFRYVMSMCSATGPMCLRKSGGSVVPGIWVNRLANKQSNTAQENSDGSFWSYRRWHLEGSRNWGVTSATSSEHGPILCPRPSFPIVSSREMWQPAKIGSSAVTTWILDIGD